MKTSAKHVGLAVGP